MQTIWIVDLFAGISSFVHHFLVADGHYPEVYSYHFTI